MKLLSHDSAVHLLLSLFLFCDTTIHTSNAFQSTTSSSSVRRPSFVVAGPKATTLTTTARRPNNRVRKTCTELQAMEIIAGPAELFDNFFRTQPFLSAFMMCSFKASAADLLAQTSCTAEKEEQVPPKKEEASISFNYNNIWNLLQNKNDLQQQHQHEQHDDDSIDHINFQRNFAFLLYGGLYQGMFLQFLYMVVYPFLYGDSMFRVPLCICSDILCFGPILTLPIAYVLRSVIENATDESSTQSSSSSASASASLTTHEAIDMGIEKYKNHIVTQNLLWKYWSVWAPAQSINFMFVPEHLRVFFVAFISFFWVYLLSSISNQQATTTTTTTTSSTTSHHQQHQRGEPLRQAS